MTTANDLIIQALKLANVLGVGQTASAEDTNDAFDALNRMLAMWQRQRQLVYHTVTFDIPCTGQQSYTVGPGGDFDMPRPNRIESAFFRQILTTSPFQYDYAVEIIEAREDYNRIGLKNLTSFPEYAFYDSGYPLGNLFFWPVPSNIYQMFISVMQPLYGIVSLADNLVLPPEYEEAIIYNLATRLYAMYSLPPNPAVVAIAKSDLAVLRGANAQIPLAKTPIDLLRRGQYNVYGDVNK